MCAAVPNTRQDSGLKVPSLRKCPSRRHGGGRPTGAGDGRSHPPAVRGPEHGETVGNTRRRRAGVAAAV